MANGLRICKICGEAKPMTEFYGTLMTCKHCYCNEIKKKRAESHIGIQNLPSEVWKDIVGYEGIYQVSNLGRIKSLNRTKPDGSMVYEKLLAISPKTNMVTLSKNKSVEHKTIHNLVASAFIPNPNKFRMVKHLDGNYHNNKSDNLAWVLFEHPVTLVCPVCGKSFVKKACRLRGSHIIGFACSVKCSKKLRSINFTNDNNHQYGLKGELNASFKGSICQRKNNNLTEKMIYVPEHPFADKSGRYLIHRLVVEQNYNIFPDKYFIMIDGKHYLKQNIVVHHKDCNHSNNDISNLMPLTKGEHTKIHNELKNKGKNGRRIYHRQNPRADAR